jgi:hypothetical protein
MISTDSKVGIFTIIISNLILMRASNQLNNPLEIIKEKRTSIVSFDIKLYSLFHGSSRGKRYSFFQVEILSCIEMLTDMDWKNTQEHVELYIENPRQPNPLYFIHYKLPKISMMVGINELTDKTKSKSLGYFHHYQKYS